MTTLFDIGDEIELTMQGKVKSFSTDGNGDCYVVELKNLKGEYTRDTRVYLDTNSLIYSDAHLLSKKTKETKPFIRGMKKPELIILRSAIECRSKAQKRVPGEQFECQLCQYGKRIKVNDTEYLNNIVCDTEKIFNDMLSILDELIGDKKEYKNESKGTVPNDSLKSDKMEPV